MDKVEILRIYKKFESDLEKSGKSEFDTACGDNPKSVAEWHFRYEKIKKEVCVIGKRADEDFLQKLFCDDHNGISAAMRGKLGGLKASPDERLAIFKKLILEKYVIESLENLIKNPCGDTGEDLLGSIYVACGRRQYVLVNRIIAACTEKASSAVDNKKCSKAFELLRKNKIINVYSGTDDNSRPVATWYDKNVCMMEALNKFIKQEIGNEPDPTLLSMIPWCLVTDNIFIKN